MFLCKIDKTECTDDPCMYACDVSTCPNRYIEASKGRTLKGQMKRLVRWLKADFEMTMYRWRPLKHCKGVGCYVYTPGRKDGVPYCLVCKEESNSLAT